MKKAILSLALVFASVLTAAAQTPQFMEVYDKALARFDRNAGIDDASLRTSEFSGKMLRSILPDKAGENHHMVNRIDAIRQIKFTGPRHVDLYDRLRRAAETEPYQRLSIMNIDKETVYIYTAPYKGEKSEFLVFIAKDDARLACDIVGDITIDDVLDLLFGRN